MITPLDALMDNVLAWCLGEIALEAGRARPDVGDLIDRGLILLRLLNERGFDVVQRSEPQHYAEGKE